MATNAENDQENCPDLLKYWAIESSFKPNFLIHLLCDLYYHQDSS